jgi:hypothetical protein
MPIIIIIIHLREFELQVARHSIIGPFAYVDNHFPVRSTTIRLRFANVSFYRLIHNLIISCRFHHFSGGVMDKSFDAVTNVKNLSHGRRAVAVDGR